MLQEDKEVRNIYQEEDEFAALWLWAGSLT